MEWLKFKRWVSCAKWCSLQYFTAQYRSFMQMRNSKGSKIEHCTQQRIKRRSDGWPSIITYKLSSILKIWKKAISCTLYTIQFNFWISILWSTVSKVFWKSTNIPQLKFPLCSCSRILSVRWINAWEVQSFCRKPKCRSCMRFLISRNSCKGLYIVLSRILSMLESKVIGQ